MLGVTNCTVAVTPVSAHFGDSFLGNANKFNFCISNSASGFCMVNF